MRRIVLATLPAFLLLAACSSSPDAQCRDALQAQCDKLFECYPEADRPDGFSDLYGTSPSEYATRLNDGYTVQGFDIPGAHCEDVTADNACQDDENGSVYHADKADACIAGFKDATCEQIKSDTYDGPAACNEVCQAS